MSVTHRGGVAEIAHMRGLLEEMGRLGGKSDVEKGGGVVTMLHDAARYAFNHTMFMSPAYVADMLKEVLAVCGTRLDLTDEALAQKRATWRDSGDQNRVIEPSLKKRMARLEQALRGGDAKYHSFVYGRMNQDFDDAIKRLTGVQDYEKALAHLKTMKSDALALNLIAYTDAMYRYTHGNERREFEGKVSVNQEFSCLQDLMRIDEKLGYTSSADKLETVLEFGSKRLSEDLRKKVERMQQAL